MRLSRGEELPSGRGGVFVVRARGRGSRGYRRRRTLLEGVQGRGGRLDRRRTGYGEPTDCVEHRGGRYHGTRPRRAGWSRAAGLGLLSQGRFLACGVHSAAGRARSDVRGISSAPKPSGSDLIDHNTME